MQAARATAERSYERAQRQRGVREAIESLRWSRDSEQGCWLAYRFFLWLVPFGLVVAAVASFWVRFDHAGLENTAKSFGLGGVAAHSAAAAVEDGSNARWYLLGAGLVLIAWAGIGTVRALRVASRLAWAVDADRLRHPLGSSGTFTVLAVVGLAASMPAGLARHHSVAVGFVITLVDLVVYFLLALFAFSHLPRPEGTSWRALWPGAVLVGAGVTAVQSSWPTTSPASSKAHHRYTEPSAQRPSSCSSCS